MPTSPPASPPAKRVKLDEPTPVSLQQTETIPQIDLERAVGITEYINPEIQGWSGILKQRYTDFLVNEIDESGNVVHLTTLTSGKPVTTPKPKEAPKKAPPPPPTIDPSEFELSPADAKTLAALTTPEIAISCTALHRQILSSPTTPPTKTITTPRIDSKDSRSHLHTLIRTVFSSTLETQTLTGENEGKILIQPSALSNTSRRRGNRGGRNQKAPAEKTNPAGEYCHFLLYKENKDTMQAVNILQKLLKLKGKSRVLGFAGTKDRRAVTVQRCSAYRVRAERLEALNRGGDNGLHTGARVGNFEYKGYGLELGDLGGNEFVITLRECSAPRELEGIVKDAVERVRDKGFINYFGLQRFGSYAVGTWEVGVKMLKGDWRGAVEKILDYDEGLLEGGGNVAREERARAEACAAFLVDYDFKKAAETIPWKYSAESAILRVFAERPQKGDGKGGGVDYLGAIQAVPRTLRTMYSHAYQSYVWNHVVSARIKMGATRVIEGDLVLVDKASMKSEEVVVEDAEVDQDGEIVVHVSVEKVDNGRPRGQDEFQRARALTKEEAESGKFTMKDIVLPTPGWDVLYPQNELLEVYKSVMAEHGLDPLNMKRTVKEYSLPGGYRKVIETFLDGKCDFEVKKYRGLEQIVKTDMEILNAKAEVKGAEKTEEKMDADESEEKMAVVLRLRLATSTYATMALRELMKEGIKAYKPEFSR